VTLIEVPYWWDRTSESLAATIHQAQPSIINAPPGSIPISTNEQRELDPLCHGMEWDGTQDVAGWWMSEKMDGIRAYWNGRNLISRYKTTLQAPDWFTSGLPKRVTLDGELWMGRGTTFVEVNAVLNSKNSDWSSIGYYVFDLPSLSGSFEERMIEMEKLKSVLPSHVWVVENIECKGTQHLQTHLNSILRSKGEGIMIRQPHSVYHRGRTPSLLKVKV